MVKCCADILGLLWRLSRRIRCALIGEWGVLFFNFGTGRARNKSFSGTQEEGKSADKIHG